MSPASKTHRREFAILAALRAAGTPLQVKHLIREAVKLGPDAPQVNATIPRMLRSGDLVLAGPQPHGTPMPMLWVTLPGCTAPIPVHQPDPCAPPTLRPEPEPYAITSELLADLDPFAKPDPSRTPPPTPEPVMTTAPTTALTHVTPLDMATAPKRRGRPPKHPAVEAPSSPVQPATAPEEGEGSTQTPVKAKRVDGSAIWLNAEAFAAWDAMLDDLRASLGFEVTTSQLVMYLFNRYRSADRV